jgi:hypothetical protein
MWAHAQRKPPTNPRPSQPPKFECISWRTLRSSKGQILRQFNAHRIYQENLSRPQNPKPMKKPHRPCEAMGFFHGLISDFLMDVRR